MILLEIKTWDSLVFRWKETSQVKTTLHWERICNEKNQGLGQALNLGV